MYPYKREQTALLYDLITEANPDVVYPLTGNNISFSNPVAIIPTAGSIADTEVMIVGNENYYGNQKVKYRRINLTNFFKGVTINLHEYHPSPQFITSDDVIRMMNEKYGLALVADDFNLFTGLTNNAIYTLTVKPNSLCYKGVFQFVWIRGGIPIGTIFTADEVSGRLYPGGNVFNEDRKPQGEYICYDLDFSPIKAVLTALPTAFTWAGQSYPAVMQFLRENVSDIFLNTALHTTYGGLNGLLATRYNTLAQQNVPEINILSPKYKSALVLHSKPDSWFQGKIIMHYMP